MSRIARNVLTFASVVVLAFAVGNVCGLYFYPRLFGGVELHDDHADPQDRPEDGSQEEHLALTKQAFENLGVRLGAITRGEYWKSLTVPGEVTEIPGKSSLSVSAPVSGIVEQVAVLEGQAMGPSDHLFTLSIIDDELTNAQSEMLATLSRQGIVRKEIDRLSPLTESGAVSGSRMLELEYELGQLESTKLTLRQEIRGRGLPDAILQDVLDTKSLATKLSVSVPTIMEVPDPVTTPVSLAPRPRSKDFSVEHIQVHPGKTVRRGDELCNLAYHAELYIEGQAFERDMSVLARIIDEDWRVSVEFGHEHDAQHMHSLRLEGLRLLRVDNHVDRDTQTSSFYLPLENEVAEFTTDGRGRAFQQWKFKPGERVHLKLPTEHWEDKLLLPLDAVVVEGPNATVFVEHVDPESDHLEADAQRHGHDDVFIEFEPVPVRLLHRDNRVAVIADDGQLSLDERVALDCAYKLHLEMKMQAAGGGGHHHHEH